LSAVHFVMIATFGGGESAARAEAAALPHLMFDGYRGALEDGERLQEAVRMWHY